MANFRAKKIPCNAHLIHYIQGGYKKDYIVFLYKKYLFTFIVGIVNMANDIEAQRY